MKLTLETPNNIEVLLHFNSCPEKHPRQDSMAVLDAIDYLLCAGAIKGKSDGNYQVTELGSKWVTLLTRVETPRLTYVDEKGEAI